MDFQTSLGKLKATLEKEQDKLSKSLKVWQKMLYDEEITGGKNLDRYKEDTKRVEKMLKNVHDRLNVCESTMESIKIGDIPSKEVKETIDEEEFARLSLEKSGRSVVRKKRSPLEISMELKRIRDVCSSIESPVSSPKEIIQIQSEDIDLLEIPIEETNKTILDEEQLDIQISFMFDDASCINLS